MLLFQRSPPLGVWNGHAPERLAPAVARLLADPVRTAQPTEGRLATLGLVQPLTDLLLRKPACSPAGPPVHERTLTYALAQFSGSRSRLAGMTTRPRVK